MFKHLACLLTFASLMTVGCATHQATNHAAKPQKQQGRTMQTTQSITAVSPALANYDKAMLQGDVWNRPQLSKRDRSVVTLASAVARGEQWMIKPQVSLALDNSVTPVEISELITHLAFYSGWGNALGAVEPTREVFADRGIDSTQLAKVVVNHLPLDEEAEAKRASFVDATYGEVSPGVVQFTTDALFRDMWLRPGLAPRDRSLVTVSALVAVGQSEQVTFHLNKAMDNGLTKDEASEVLTQLAFYAGWPRVFSAMPVFKKVFESRQ